MIVYVVVTEDVIDKSEVVVLACVVVNVSDATHDIYVLDDMVV